VRELRDGQYTPLDPYAWARIECFVLAKMLSQPWPVLYLPLHLSSCYLCLFWFCRLINICIRWLYRRVLVYDGNFSNEHMRMRQPWLDAGLTDGEGYVVGENDYQYHLKHSVEIKQVSLHCCKRISAH
jgi:hypothetical protein